MTDNADADWGPWLVHDGKGCPCVGQYVQVRFVDGDEAVGPAGIDGGACWIWSSLELGGWHHVERGFAMHIVEFRIRRPKGMAILNAILADLPAPVKTDGVIA